MQTKSFIHLGVSLFLTGRLCGRSRAGLGKGGTVCVWEFCWNPPTGSCWKFTPTLGVSVVNHRTGSSVSVAPLSVPGFINFFMWSAFLILLWPAEFSMTTAFPFFSTTWYGSGSNVGDNLFSRFWRSKIRSPSAMSLLVACLFKSAYSFSLNFLQAYLSLRRIGHSASVACSRRGWTYGNLSLSFLPIRSSAGDNEVTVWGVLRYWKRKSCTSLFQSVPCSCAILIAFRRVLLSLSTSPSLWGPYGTPCDRLPSIEGVLRILVMQTVDHYHFWGFQANHECETCSPDIW